jgi:YggT family protein
VQDLLSALYLYFISPILTIYFFAIIAYVVLGWLLMAGVVEQRNMTVQQIYSFLHSIIEPVAGPIRRFVPPIGNLDLSVLIILLAIPFIRDWLLPRLIMAVPF